MVILSGKLMNSESSFFSLLFYKIRKSNKGPLKSMPTVPSRYYDDEGHGLELKYD